MQCALRRARPLVLALLAPLLVSACVDAPAAPEGVGAASFIIAPAFSLVGPEGPARNEGQADALNEAFDLVDRFRMQVRKASDNALVLDTVLVVTPGGQQYDLSVPIAAANNEQFLVTLIAMQGETELFKAENIPATASPAGLPAGAPPPTPVQIPLVYSGPGATADAVDVGPEQLVLPPGGAGIVGASVVDDDGAVVAGVTLGWTSSAPGVASVAAGNVTAAGEGVAVITATTPTGLSASATVYVVGGELAYVEGGALRVRGAAGGTPADRADAAGQPAWSPDGARLYYVSGGTVHRAGGSALLQGSHPSISPDGTKLAVERDGQVVFANEDGSGVTGGPAGTAPLWRDASTLFVGGGSIQQVRADGAERVTVVPGEAALPALAADGRLAWVEGGTLRAADVEAALATGVTGRPTWSPNGLWIAVGTATGVVLVPSDGNAPAVALPGLGGAADPVFKPTGGLAAVPGVRVDGFNPDPPQPGQPVQILGEGFDWIIPSNNQVFWPTRDGAVAGEIQAVSPNAIASVMPRGVVAGQVRVETRGGSGLLLFEPTFGALDVRALAPWGAGVEGVALVLEGGGSTRNATTGSSGLAQFDGLVPGSHTLTVTPPEGWTLSGEATRSLAIGAATSDLELSLTPTIESVTLTPGEPAVEVGGTLAVSLSVTGVGGLAIPQVGTLAWRSASPELAVTPGEGFNATLGGVFPGEGVGTSTLEVDVDGRTFTFPVSVTSTVQGTVTLAGAEPAPAADVGVEVKRGGTVVAQARTGADGTYRVTGLFAGSYDVAPAAAADRLPVPEGQTVILDQANPSGTADFRMVPFATLEVTSRTPWDTPAGGTGIRVLDAAGGEVATGTADAAGNLRIARIPPGSYTVAITPPAGFQLQGERTRSLDLSGTVALALVLDPAIAQVRVEPAEPTLVVGQAINVTATALDYNGGIIPQFRSATWFARTGHVAAAGVGLQGQVGGNHPSGEGEARYAIELNGQVFEFAATVTGHIQGTVTLQTADGSEPSVGTGITLERDGAEVGRTSTQGGGAYRFEGLVAGTYTVRAGAPAGMTVSPASRTVPLGAGAPHGTADFTVVAGGDAGERRPGDIVIYKDYNAWFGENKDETTLQAAPFNFVRDQDYSVRPTSDLKTGIASTTSLIIITSASNGSTPIPNVNHPDAQANLAAWVQGGGWLLAHLGDNVGGDGFLIPGMGGKPDEIHECVGATLANASHPFVLGPDGVAGTGDDLTDTNIDNGGRFCSDNHGSLAGILPDGAEVLMVEGGGDQRPIYATYTYGSGRVVVTTLTIEFGPHTQQTLTNHLWWTIMSGAAPAAVAPNFAAPLDAVAPAGELPRTDVVPAGPPAAIRYSPWRGVGAGGR